MYFEIGMPTRRIVNETEYNNLINKYNGIKNIYRTVCDYREIKDNKIVPESICLDKVFFDFDGDGAYEQTVKFHNLLSDKKLKHDIRFSGGGFHIFLYLRNYTNLKNPKSALLNIHNHFYNLGFKFDKQIIGDISRMSRVPNTFNVKRNRYCIYLSKEDLEMSFDKIKEKALNQSFKKYVYGKEGFDAKPFDNGIDNHFELLKVESEAQIKIDKDKFLSLLPPCISNMLIEGELKYRQRFYVLTYLSNKGFSKNEALKIIKPYLKENRFEHIVSKERHIDYIFKRDNMFPSCKQIKGEGYCPLKEVCKQIKELYR